MNPAASGTDIEKDINYFFGTNRQWADIPGSPRQTFLNISYTIRPFRAYKRWQNVGLYYDGSDAGLLSSVGLYGSYTAHFLLRKKLIASVGVLAGTRRYTRSIGFDPMDPAVSKTRASVFVYPDIIPGIRLTDKKYYVGLSLRQITITKLKNFKKGRRIGSPSKLQPGIYFEYGKFITLSEYVLMMPSIALNTPIISLPTVDATLMFYIANRLGLGIGLKNTSMFSGILQIRFLGNMTAGFAYTYPINNTKYVAGRSFEIMVGVVPMGMSEKLTGRHSIAKCPTLFY